VAFDRSRSAGYLINQLARIFAQALAERIKPLGLVPGQFPVLLALWEQEGLTQRELVEKLDVEQATIANTLARMERDGLIVRRPRPDDRRSQSIRLTPRARALEAPATSAASAVNATMLAGLTAGEREQVLAAMRGIIGKTHGPRMRAS
jgi:DNA-binding MarR family transcriptional regulator